MIAQLELFATARPNLQRRTSSAYRETDPTLAQQMILSLCLQAGEAWTPIRRIFRSTGMHPRYVAAITSSMTRSGLLEETQLHYRGATPGAADYCGFQHGYRTAKRVARR